MDTRIINHESKQVITFGMCCPWDTNREKRKEEKTTKYGLLRISGIKAEVPRRHKVKQCSIIMDVLGGWCRDLEVKFKDLVGSKSEGVLHNIKKAVLSGTFKHRSPDV